MLFQCKMCGGALEIKNNDTVGVCEYCGTRQTFPRLDNDKKANLYERAAKFRQSNDYDGARLLYEQILAEDKTDAEAYWSIVLCRYGIEYVEDPRSHKRIPTVNRVHYEPVEEDQDYLQALEHADVESREIYQAEAKQIDRIQKNILSISKNEDPYDVFICYKETDDKNERTYDSVIGYELYRELTKEGLKVFFSRITLEDKLGTVYEPYIFAALNSAKVMLVIGTKPEYLNAVWVRNEWSRFLTMMKEGKKKYIIPLFKDMDPRDLPKEMARLQAQDMSKIGAIQDVVHGVVKLIRKDNKVSVVVDDTVSTDSLMKRGLYELEDKEWENAKTIFNRVLDVDPENGDAYIGLLLAEMSISDFKDLGKCNKRFDNTNEYKKAIRFADHEVTEQLKKYSNHVNAAIAEKVRQEKYDLGKERFDAAVTIDNYKSVASIFRELGGYKDSSDYYNKCLLKERELDQLKEKVAKRKKRRNVLIVVADIVGALFILCLLSYKKYISPQIMYNEAEKLMENGKYDEAIEIYNDLLDYKDAKEKVTECKSRKEEEHLRNASIGDYVKFGFYEQDNDTSNGREDIEWRVIDKENDRILIISKYALDCLQFNEIGANVTWEKCSLRKWLNDSFLRSAFPNEDESVILNSTVSAHMNPDYNNTNPGNDTTDRVFLLSVREARELFEDNEDRVCIPTSYAIAQGASTSDSNEIDGIGGACVWWLRTPGFYAGSAANVYSDGSVAGRGDGVNMVGIAVRPVLWIDTSLLSIYK